MERKQRIIEGLRSFAAQRGGIEPRNYGSWQDYRAESRSVTRDLHDARELVRAIEWRDSVTAGHIIAASKHAYSGRLTIIEREDGAVAVDYCTGQYFPTEYRKATAAVCASALWDWQRESMPKPFKVYGTDDQWYALKTGDKPPMPVSAGDWLRSTFRREFGRRLQSRYFN